MSMRALDDMKHVYEQHTSCTRFNCPVCEGGLAICVVCGGAEGSLATDCPGRQLTEDEQDDVYRGLIDYMAGVWIPGCHGLGGLVL